MGIRHAYNTTPDDRDDLDCQESLEVEFLAHAGPD